MTERKKEILSLSQSVLKEKGYAATSVRDIAKALDMEPASLYSHFKSKEDILKITCFEMADKFELAVKEVNDIYFNAEEKLLLILPFNFYYKLSIGIEKPTSNWLLTLILF